MPPSLTSCEFFTTLGRSKLRGAVVLLVAYLVAWCGTQVLIVHKVIQETTQAKLPTPEEILTHPGTIAECSAYALAPVVVMVHYRWRGEVLAGEEGRFACVGFGSRSWIVWKSPIKTW